MTSKFDMWKAEFANYHQLISHTAFIFVRAILRLLVKFLCFSFLKHEKCTICMMRKILNKLDIFVELLVTSRHINVYTKWIVGPCKKDQNGAQLWYTGSAPNLSMIDWLLLIDWRFTLLSRLFYHARAHIFMYFLGFIGNRLELWNVLSRTSPVKKKKKTGDAVCCFDGTIPKQYLRSRLAQSVA